MNDQRIYTNLDIAAMTTEELRHLQLSDLNGGLLTKDHIKRILAEVGQVWMHAKDDMRKPHAKLPDGCTDGYIDVRRAITLTNICRIFGWQLYTLLKAELDAQGLKPDWVIGIDHSGVPLAYVVAEFFGCQYDFTQKTSDNRQTYNRLPIKPDEVVVIVDEIAARLSSAGYSRDALTEAHSYPLNFAPVIGMFVNRSDRTDFSLGGENPARIISAVEYYGIQTYSKENCPYCKAGSPCLHPKETGNWEVLTQQSL